jgi:pimeloyl-ACP methyl ester carboxylesterase
MGGTNAQRLAVDHPTRVRGLVLAGSFAGYRDKPDMVAFEQAVAALVDPIDPGFVREFQEATLAVTADARRP